jgi:hypothetical protein
MSNTVRAKFRVATITRSLGSRFDRALDKYVPQETQTIRLQPVYDDGNPENKRFFESTPSGNIELGVMNVEAAQHFDLNADYYVDFTKAE